MPGGSECNKRGKKHRLPTLNSHEDISTTVTMSPECRQNCLCLQLLQASFCVCRVCFLPQKSLLARPCQRRRNVSWCRACLSALTKIERALCGRGQFRLIRDASVPQRLALIGRRRKLGVKTPESGNTHLGPIQVRSFSGFKGSQSHKCLAKLLHFLIGHACETRTVDARPFSGSSAALITPSPHRQHPPKGHALCSSPSHRATVGLASEVKQ